LGVTDATLGHGTDEPVPTRPTPWSAGWTEWVAAQARTLTERLGDPRSSGPWDEARADMLWDRWCDRTAAGDARRFREQLAWDGLAEEDVRRVLGAEPTPPAPIPSWVDVLEVLPDACGAVAGGEGDPALDPDHPLPFERLLLPFLVVARRQVPADAPDESLGQRPTRDLEGELLKRLVPVVSRAALGVFDSERPAGIGRLAALVPGGGAGTRTLHDGFVASELASGMARTLGTFPVAARLACTLVELWLEERAEFVTRLREDRPLLEEAFGGGAGLGPIERLEGGLSDPHGRGRAVRVLHFAGGARVVYKPKSVAAESAFARLLDWCGEGRGRPFLAPAIVDRGSHGWVQFIERIGPSTEEDRKAFFHGAGRLLALLHATRTTDCHAENLIPHGSHMVLVDAEAVLRPELVEEETHPEATQADVFAARFVAESVLSTGLVPHWRATASGEPVDVSALGATPQPESTLPAWRGIGTDGIQFGRLSSVGGKAPSSGERLQGTPGAEAFAEAIEAGFRTQYEALAERREDLLDGDAWATLTRAEPRFVFRDTSRYMDLLRHALEPGYLRDGAAWSIELRGLGRAMHAFRGGRPPAWPLFRAELEALEVLDIPIFHGSPSSTDLLVGGARIEGLVRSAPLDDAVARVQALSRDDLERQAATLRASLYGLRARGGQAGKQESSERSSFIGVDDGATPDFIDVARGIARDFMKQAARMEDGSVTWIGPRFHPHLGRYVVAPVDHSLFSGTAGIGLFFSAYARLTGEEEAKEWAIASLRGPTRLLRAAVGGHADDGFGPLLDLMGIGGMTGLGGLVYGLTVSSVLLDEPDLLEGARLAARLISDQRIEADRAFDVLSGSAGAALALLALHGQDGDRATLDRAVRCGEHLLQSRDRGLPGSAWPVFGGVHLTGMSHGAAGIALALARLFEVTGDGGMLEAALDAVRFERGHFDEEQGNWRDLRLDGVSNDGFAWTWCNGAPGIGLARILCLRALGERAPHATEPLAEDARRALEAMEGVELPVDHLCCGNMGLVEIEMEASRAPRPLTDPRRPMDRARNVLRRSRRRAHFALFGTPPAPVFVPAFFQGLAGVGYGALRLAGPNPLPSVLGLGAP
jgi:type 2 lantibiotic biosynthesis protein LanM